MIVNCKEIREESIVKIRESLNNLPLLKNINMCFIQVGDRKDSSLYIKNKKKTCELLGLGCQHIQYSNDISTNELIDNIKNMKERYTGFMVQLPLPEHIDEKEVLKAVGDKDLDGLSKDSTTIPCTALAVDRVLEYVYPNELSDKKVCIIGRSKLVGKPLAHLLIDKCSISVLNSKTPREVLIKDILNSDIIVSATGKVDTLSEKDFTESQLKKLSNKTIIDVGINYLEDGIKVGDINKKLYDYFSKAVVCPNHYVINGEDRFINGVGSLTTIELCVNAIHLLSKEIGLN